MDVITLFELATIVLGVVLFVWLAVRGERLESFILLMAMVVGLSLEVMGVRFFELYYYSDDFIVVLGEFPETTPLAIIFGWALVFFTSRRLADRLVLPWWLTPAVAGLLAVSLDFFLDPMLAAAKSASAHSIQQCVADPIAPVSVGAGAWYWCLISDLDMDDWLGIPAGNYQGWFITVAGYTLVVRFARVKGWLTAFHPVWRQLLTLAVAAAVALLIIAAGLYLFRWLHLEQRVDGWIILSLLLFLGAWGLVMSASQRTQWGFEWPAVSLLVMDALICWYGFFSGQTDLVGSQAWILAGFTGGAIVLALWILVGIPWPGLTVAEPFPINPQYPLSPAQVMGYEDAQDPPADTVMNMVYNSPGMLDDVNSLMQTLTHSFDSTALGTLDTQLGNYADQVMGMANTFDQAAIERGQALFQEHSGVCVSALTVASLPESYGMQRGAAVLARTGRLQTPEAFKRIVETAQFLLYVVEPNGLRYPDGDPEVGRGTFAIMRIRLLHAAIRWLVEQQVATAPPDELAAHYEFNTWNWQPINQVEMAFTIQCFCWVTLRAIRDSRGQVSEDQANDYVYLWSCVGRMMGVQDDLLPADFIQASGNVHQAAGLFDIIKQETHTQTEDCRVLTQAALTVMNQMMRRKANLGPVLNVLMPRILIHDWLDDETLDLLQVPRLTPMETNVLRPMVRGLFSLYGYVDDVTSEGFDYAVQRTVGLRLLEYYVDHPDEVDANLFNIPDSLGI